MKKPLVIDLNDAIQHPGKHLDFEISTNLEEVEDIDLLQPIAGNLHAVSTGNMLLLRGKFDTTAVVECSRCLSPINLELEFEVDEQFPVAGIPASGGGNTYAHVEEDEPSPLFDGNSLRVEELLRQDLLLALPAQPLCSPDCQGIDLGPSESEGRPEFAELQKLLTPEEKGS
ncbi:MAG: DUF177 domain-containing protein [Fimbriimonadales bacterium]|nr:DUF177 domain-containing protein [Fimbriimonadales bacterium]